MEQSMASPRRTRKETIRLSKLLTAQRLATDDLLKALPKGGASLALVKQKRNQLAKEIRATFAVVQGGLA